MYVIRYASNMILNTARINFDKKCIVSLYCIMSCKFLTTMSTPTSLIYVTNTPWPCPKLGHVFFGNTINHIMTKLISVISLGQTKSTHLGSNIIENKAPKACHFLSYTLNNKTQREQEHFLDMLTNGACFIKKLLIITRTQRCPWGLAQAIKGWEG